MTPEIERLLGGYATNSLTEEERKLLFEAALDDQDLFNALEEEQALRDLLQDEESRREIVRALRPAPKRPSRLWIWGLAASVAATAVLVLVLIPRETPKPTMTVALSSARLSAPRDTALPAPPAAPARAVPVPRKKAAARPVPPPPVSAATVAPSSAPAAAPTQTTLARLSVERQLDAVMQAKQSVGGAGVAGANAFLPSAGLVKAESKMAPWQFERTLQDGTTADLTDSEIVQSGDSILVKLRSGLAGSVTVSEFSDSGWKPLPAGTPIAVDRRKMVRLEWLPAPDSTPMTSYLTLAPGEKPVIQP
jgi:hypothetical protein